MRQVDVAAVAVDATTGAPIVVLREQDAPHRLLPIFIGGAEAAAIALAAQGEAPPRPLTHDVMAELVRSFDGHLDAVEVTALRDGSYFAALAMHGPTGPHRLDTRPSDAIALAMRLGAPLFVADEVLDEAGSEPPVELDDEAIDEAVQEFRSFLDDVDPATFVDEAIDADAPTDDDDGTE